MCLPDAAEAFMGLFGLQTKPVLGAAWHPRLMLCAESASAPSAAVCRAGTHTQGWCALALRSESDSGVGCGLHGAQNHVLCNVKACLLVAACPWTLMMTCTCTSSGCVQREISISTSGQHPHCLCITKDRPDSHRQPHMVVPGDTCNTARRTISATA